MVLFPSRRDPFQDFSETRLTVSVFRREIGAADEWFQIGCEPDAHRPAAAAGRCLDEGHVNAIDVGPFFTIDFDVHKVAVHDRGGRFIFERFVRHDVAPVTGGVTNREEDRFVFPAGFGERFFAPRIPINRIVRVLEKVG